MGSDDGKAAQDTVAPNLDRGPGNSDTPHRFVFSAVWDIKCDLSNAIAKALANGWQLSTIAQVQSGRRFSALVSGDPNNDGNRNTDRVPYLGRNTILGPTFAQWDLRLSRDFPVMKERVKLRLLGEGFNLRNRANLNTLQNTQSSLDNGRFKTDKNFLLPQRNYADSVLQLAREKSFSGPTAKYQPAVSFCLLLLPLLVRSRCSSPLMCDTVSCGLSGSCMRR